MGVEQAGAYSPFRNAKDLGDLGVGHSLNVEHGNHGSMISRQFLHSLVQSLLQFAQICLPDGSARGRELDEFLVVLNAGIHVVQAHLVTPSALFQEVDGHIHRDRMDPGVKARLAAEAFDGAVGFGPDVLQQIVRVLVVRGHVIDQAVEAGAVFDDQFVESRGVARLGPGDEFVILFSTRVFSHCSRLRSRLCHGRGSRFRARVGRSRPGEDRSTERRRETACVGAHLPGKDESRGRDGRNAERRRTRIRQKGQRYGRCERQDRGAKVGWQVRGQWKLGGLTGVAIGCSKKVMGRFGMLELAPALQSTSLPGSYATPEETLCGASDRGINRKLLR